MRACALRAAALAMLAGLATPARAERLVSSLSDHRVQINSSFTGKDLVIFGTIEADSNGAPRRAGYDIVVTVVGPRDAMVTRRKERVLGLWVNAQSRVFVDPPIYLAVLSTRPVEQIAPPDVLRRLQVGLNNFILRQRIGPDIADVVPSDPFRMAFLRQKKAQLLYYELPQAVTFPASLLYRATIPVPGSVPVGSYDVDVKLFAEGAMIARTTSAFEIIKTGFEQVVSDGARYHGLLYGLATTAMALLTGWFASVVFRRD
jgi:uncharacterized protein (TIGR02186 family)